MNNDKKENNLKPEKKDLIEKINYNFRAILSYGTANELVPAGQFIVKDILKDPATNSKNLILEQIDNPSINIIIPKEIFTEFIEMAIKNSSKLKIDKTPLIDPVEKTIKSLSEDIILDEFLTDLQEVDVLPIGENGVTLIKDGFITPTNYSICPVYIEALQKNLEREITLHSKIPLNTTEEKNKKREQLKKLPKELKKKDNKVIDNPEKDDELPFPGTTLPDQPLKPIELETRPFSEDDILCDFGEEPEDPERY